MEKGKQNLGFNLDIQRARKDIFLFLRDTPEAEKAFLQPVTPRMDLSPFYTDRGTELVNKLQEKYEAHCPTSPLAKTMTQLDLTEIGMRHRFRHERLTGKGK